ncbi:MAG: hypothetical protein K2X27_09965 [Candidatus Obscuribacterales bacterium]|nr:hypothetical protein [Candidatus Obscuribacterales bacterium]
MKEADNTGFKKAEFEDPCIKEAEEAQSTLPISTPAANSESQEVPKKGQPMAKQLNPEEDLEQVLRNSIIASLEKPKRPLLRWGIQHQVKVIMLLIIGWQVYFRLGLNRFQMINDSNSWVLWLIALTYFVAQMPMFIHWCHYLQKLQNAAASLPAGQLKFSPLKTKITNLFFGPHSLSIALTAVAFIVSLLFSGPKPDTMPFLQNLIAASSLVVISLTAPLMVGGIFYLEIFSDLNRKIKANNGEPPMPAFLAALVVILGLLCPSFLMAATLYSNFTPFAPLAQAIGILAAFMVSNKYGNCLQLALLKAAKIQPKAPEKESSSAPLLENFQRIPKGIFNLISAVDKLRFWPLFAITMTVMFFQGIFHLQIADNFANPKDSLNIINNAIFLNPTSSQNFSTKARIEERLGSHEAALTSIEEAIKLDPTFQGLRLEKFKVLAFKLHRFPEAYKLIDQEINDSQKNGREYLLLNLYQNRIWLDALRNDQKALAGDTENYEKIKRKQHGQQIDLARKLESEGKIEDAVKTVNCIGPLLDNEVIELRARILEKSKNPGAAISCYIDLLIEMPEEVQKLPFYSKEVAKYEKEQKRLESK